MRLRSRDNKTFVSEKDERKGLCRRVSNIFQRVMNLMTTFFFIAAKIVSDAAVLVPTVVAVALFVFVVAIIKYTKIRRSAGPAGSSNGNEATLLPHPQSTDLTSPFTEQSQRRLSSQSMTTSTGAAPPSYEEVLSEGSVPVPSSSDYSQAVPNNQQM